MDRRKISRLERFAQGPNGDLDNNFTKDELLTNISIYWFTNSITSSTRIYYETAIALP